MNDLKWRCLSFDALSIYDLYSILQLRQKIFIVEQDCPYLDADGEDHKAIHVLGCHTNTLCCYVRIFPPIEGQGAIIGRVMVHKDFRGKGMGYILMKHAHRYITQHFPDNPYIKLGAQAHLENFYGALGYKLSGNGYLEDGIPHIPMIKY